MRTKQRLAEALNKAGAPIRLARNALRGQYDDYESDDPFPKLTLVRDLLDVGLLEFAERVTAGEFDNTQEEAREWLAQGEEV